VIVEGRDWERGTAPLSAADVLDPAKNRRRSEILAVSLQYAGQPIYPLRGNEEQFWAVAASHGTHHREITTPDEFAEITAIGSAVRHVERQPALARCET
jgi:hypothetical protein